MVLISCLALQGKAQLYYNNQSARFFRNNYLANPAYAGSRNQPFLYALVNRSWIGFDGAPTLIQFAGDLPFGAHSGAGLQVASDKSGMLQRTYAKLSYAYKIKLGGNSEWIKLGFSLTGYRQRLDAAAVSSGGAIDPAAKAFNDQNWHIDGDFGAVYQTEGFQFSATTFNLRKWFPDFSNQPVDLETLALMTSYTFQTSDNIELKPLLAARFFTKSNWVAAVGGQLSYDHLFHASAIWQNTGSVVGTLGLMVKQLGELNFTYATNNKQGYGQQYEVGLGVALPGKKLNEVKQKQ
ncbi:hypothetical protein FLA_4202 [Filimonas lacunae]|nr:hypothetical protein FLA_4202 [Filimonas lacunae]